MHRILASIVLAAISFTLMPAALFASADSDVPACCRKDGKHKCVMASMTDDEAPGLTLRGVSQCPMTPAKSCATQASSVYAAPAPERVPAIHVATFLNRTAQIEAQYRVSYNRSRQKRGPPFAVLPLKIQITEI